MDRAHEGHEANPCGAKRLHLKIAGRAIDTIAVPSCTKRSSTPGGS